MVEQPATTGHESLTQPIGDSALEQTATSCREMLVRPIGDSTVDAHRSAASPPVRAIGRAHAIPVLADLTD